jgi:hypothetical protein
MKISKKMNSKTLQNRNDLSVNNDYILTAYFYNLLFYLNNLIFLFCVLIWAFILLYESIRNLHDLLRLKIFWKN